MTTLFPEQIINAIFEVLLYSFCFGIILAVFAGIIVLSTKKVSARIRHHLLVAALGVFAGAVVVRFIQLTGVEPVVFSGEGCMAGLQNNSIQTGNTISEGGYQAITGFFHTYANAIVLLWSLIVVIKAFQLMIGLKSLSILKTRDIRPVSDELQARADLLARTLCIDRVVRVMASGVAKVPMVIGHLKPIVLLPAGLITSLSPESIEGILVHELAHIRRRDWLINLFLNALEIIFFFNPAVLWVASLVRTERENCCDDIALAHTGCKTSYIDTLVACEEYRSGSARYALAFSGAKKPLLARVKRMISNENASLNFKERGIILFSLLLTLIAAFSFSVTIQAREQGDLPMAKIAPQGNSSHYDCDNTPPAKSNTSILFDKLAMQNDSLLAKLVAADSLRVLNDSIAFELHKKAMADPAPLESLAELDQRLNGSNSDAEKLAYGQRDGNSDPDLDGLVAVLITAGVIRHKDDLKSFKLSDTEFIMNGAMMPDDIYLPLRRSFVPVLKNGHWQWMYNFKT